MRRVGILIAGFLVIVVFGYSIYQSAVQTSDLPLPKDHGNWLITDGDSCRRRYADAPVIKKPFVAWRYPVRESTNLSEPVIYGDNYIAVGSNKGSVILIDSEGVELWRKRVNYSPLLGELDILSPAFTSSGEIVTEDFLQSLHVYDINGKHLKKFSFKYPGEFNVIQEPPDWIGDDFSILSGMAEDKIVLTRFDNQLIFHGYVYNFTLDEQLNFHYITFNSEFCFGNMNSGKYFRSRAYRGLGMQRSFGTDDGVLLISSNGRYGMTDYEGSTAFSTYIEGSDDVILGSTIDKLKNIYLSTRKSVLKTDSVGDVIWRKTFDEELGYNLTAINDDLLVVLDYETNLYCIRTSDGEVAWSIRVVEDIAVTEIAVACDGTIYISIWGHGVFAVRDTSRGVPNRDTESIPIA